VASRRFAELGMRTSLMLSQAYSFCPGLQAQDQVVVFYELVFPSFV
jgi:hypothetical protein